LVLDRAPIIDTNSITKDFNIYILDNDLNLDSISLIIDNLDYNYSLISDNNNHYIYGSGKSSSGSHLLEITACDYANNCVDKNYTYTIQRRSSGGGGSSTTSILILDKNIVDNNTSNNTVDINKTSSTTKITKDYTFVDIVDLNNVGKLVVDNNFLPILTFYDSNSNKITDLNLKIFENNILIYSGNIHERLILDNNMFLDKNLLVFGYLNDKILFKNQLYIPKVIQNIPDVNNNLIKPFDSNNTNLEIAKPNNTLIYLFSGFVIIVIFWIFSIYFAYNKRQSLLAKQKKYK